MNVVFPMVRGVGNGFDNVVQPGPTFPVAVGDWVNYPNIPDWLYYEIPFTERDGYAKDWPLLSADERAILLSTYQPAPPRQSILDVISWNTPVAIMPAVPSAWDFPAILPQHISGALFLINAGLGEIEKGANKLALSYSTPGAADLQDGMSLLYRAREALARLVGPIS